MTHIPASPALRKKFAKWITKNGGTVLDPCRSEFIRFRAMDGLCIVYGKKGRIGSMVGDETAGCWTAFMAGQALDLSSSIESRRGATELQARRSAALAAADVRAGRSDPISIRALCRSLDLPIRTIAKVVRANGACVRGVKIVRASL